MRDDFLTISQLNRFIRDVLISGFPQPIWVCGEIQGLKEKNRHLYFTVVEKDPQGGSIVAKIDVKIWANNRLRIDAILDKAQNPFQLKDDIEVKLLCKVDFYPPFGQISLIAESIDPIHTLGKLAQDRLKLIALLKQQGTLDRNKMVGMPPLPLRIGLITSHDSAAYHDFMDELKKSGYAFQVWAANAIMQGKNSEKSVAGLLKTLNSFKDIDVIVITRGGGSIAELSCFDSRLIAEAVAASRLPVLSGIGHEINTTVTDLAAHTFAKTPTAAAQFLISRVRQALEHLDEKGKLLARLALDGVITDRRKVQAWALALHSGTRKVFKDQHQHMARIKESLRGMPLGLIKASRLGVGGRTEGLKKTIHLRLQNSRTKIKSYQKLVEMADPKNTLRRGFSITRDGRGKALRSASALKLAQEITTELADGVFSAEVKKIG